MSTGIRRLILPGYGGSGEKHWQSIWEKQFDSIERVEQADWDHPQRDLWVKTLNASIQNSNQKCVLIGHSLACSLVAHWAEKHDTSNVIGALLVSPADVESNKHTPEEIRNFAPMPRNKLPFKSIVVASDNDPYVDLDRAEKFAQSWGSECINIGSYGHINAESGLADWAYGKSLLEHLIK